MLSAIGMRRSLAETGVTGPFFFRPGGMSDWRLSNAPKSQSVVGADSGETVDTRKDQFRVRADMSNWLAELIT